MVSSVAKGKKYVNEAMELEESLGYKCWKPGNKATFFPNKKWHPGSSLPKFIVSSQSQDVFRVADYIRSDVRPALVQVTTAYESSPYSLAGERRAKFDNSGLKGFSFVIMARVENNRDFKWLKWWKNRLKVLI